MSGVNLQVNVDPQHIEKHVTEAIIQSSFGTLMKDAIEKAIKSLGSQYSYDNQLQKWVEQKMRSIVDEYVTTHYSAQIETQIKEWLSEQKMQEVTDKVIKELVNRLTVKERY
jgi:uncharacterized membrane-anchored protein YjiN (DUF445 family)